MNLTINIETWLTDRELSYCPKHFVKANTPLFDKSKIWILERLHGRFYIQNDHLSFIPFFEDPEEAMLYELTWS